MKNWLAGIIDNESGAMTSEHGLIMILLPILFVVLVVATGISMAMGAALLEAPSVIAKVLPVIATSR